MRKTTLGEIAPNITSGSRGWASFYSEKGALFLRMTNLPKIGIGLLLHDNKYVKLPENFSEGTRTRVQVNDILISITAELGKIGFINHNLGEAYVNQHIALVRVKDASVSPKFLAHYLASQPERNRLNRLNDSGAKAGLSLRTINRFPVLLPPLPEQKAIADLLSTWDEAIEKTERLIRAKEKRFKWLLHTLISKQCTSNHKEWKKMKLGEVFNIYSHSSKSQYITEDGENYIIDMGSVSRDFRLIATKRTNISDDLLDVGDIVMPKDDIGGGNIIGKVVVIKESNKFVCGDHVYRLVQKQKHDIDFLYFLINSNAINHQLRAKSNGTSQLGLGKHDLQKQKLYIPPFIKQVQIAETLSSVQQEIDLIRILLEKYKIQKRGLMQKMLTGQWRVKENVVKKYE